MSKPKASGVTALQAILERDQLIAIACLAGVIALCWAYLLTGAGKASPAMAMQPDWNTGYTLIMLAMWWIMMIAMMLPSAAPMILLFALLNRRNTHGSLLAVVAFVLAYMVAWGGFSLAATALQWGLERADLLSPAMASTSAALGAALLIAAGIWQMTPLKHACLRHCRSPVMFFALGWRPGAGGAFRMGLVHGVFCLGCCWVLMVLLFYGGVMNLWWIAGLAAYVLVEKIAPAGHWLGRSAGILLIAWGGWVLYAGVYPAIGS